MKYQGILSGVCAALLSGAVISCGGEGKNADSLTPAARQHAAMRASLRDSVEKYSRLASSLQAEIDTLTPRFNSLLDCFEMDIRPEYVEHYRVARGWKGYDTMSATGILARLTEDGTPELIATNSGMPFTSVSVEADGDKASTSPVAQGTDLNYTVGNVTRVAFIGDDALRLCRFAAARGQSDIRLVYSGKTSSAITLSRKQKDMLALMARAIDTKQRLDSLERKHMAAFNKMQLYQGEVNKDSTAAVTKK